MRRLLVPAVLLALAAPAEAKIVRAENVLPPGQSGYVSITGVPNGEGSPHLYDQTQLYLDFKRKPFTFDRPAESTEMPFAGVTIKRDQYGVPSVTGDTELNAWKGAGYAIAQDRMFQLVAFKHATSGRLGEITGEGALEDDAIARRDFYTPAERKQQFDRLPAAFQQRIEAYRDGINVWVEHLRANPSEIPGEFPATTTDVPTWTVDDTLAIGIYLARTVPSGDGNELSNLRALQESGSPKVLDRLLPLSIKGQLSTIPKREGRFPQGKALSRKAARAARRRSLKYVAGLPKATPARRQDLAPGRIGRVGGSYMFAARKPGGGAVLFNGPQLGYSIPELFVELEVHAPGLDVRGVTAAGAPVVAIGHNADVAWGITSGLSDDDDLYAEKLVPGSPEKYMFKGKVRQMDCRDEVLKYDGPPTDLLGGTVPGSGSKTERFCRTVHGPVQERADGVAYARRYAIFNRELETLEGLAAVDTAKDIKDVQAAVRKLTWNENLMAADSAGNIGYWHPGLLQIRPRRWDQRLPLPGDGRAEWPGLVPRAKLPSVINPKQGWLANWNNIPSQGWTTGDGESTERVTGPFHRVNWLMRQVRKLHKDGPTFAGAETAVMRAGTFAQQRVRAGGLLRRARQGSSGHAKAVLDTLLAWSGNYDETDSGGTVDPGVGTWELFKELAAKRAVAPLGKGAARFSDRPGTSHAFDITDKEAFALRTLSRKALRAVAADVFDAQAKAFGSEDPATWRSPRAMYDVASQGAGSPPELPFFDRGTYEQIVELSP